MKRLKNITILLCFLSLLAFISCSAEDKTGVKNNPPENDTEITDGETGSGGTGSGSSSGGSSGTETDGGSGEGGSGSGSGGTGSGSSSGGSSGTETDGGSGEGGSGSGSGGTGSEGGSEEDDGIEVGYFPPPEGKYKSDTRRWEGDGLIGSYFEPKVSTTIDGKTTIEGDLILHGSNIENGRYESRNAEFNVLKWRKTTKDGKITKTEAVEIEPYKILGNGKNETPTFTEVIYDYETKTLSITCKVTIDGIEKTLSTKSEKY